MVTIEKDDRSSLSRSTVVFPLFLPRDTSKTRVKRNIERKYLPCNRPRPVQRVRDWLRKQQRLYPADDTEFATRFYRVCV